MIEHVITETGHVVRRNISERVIDADLASIAIKIARQDLDILTPRVAVPLELGASRLHFYQIGGNPVLSCFKMQEIALKTAWEILPDGSSVPQFTNGPAVDPGTKFHVPSFLDLWFLVNSANQESWLVGLMETPEAARNENSELPAKRWVKPPLPNVFNDGRLCKGRNFLEGELSIMEAAQRTLEVWQKAPWNADLLDAIGLRDCRELYRLDPNGKAVDASHEQWFATCPVVAPTDPSVLGFCRRCSERGLG